MGNALLVYLKANGVPHKLVSKPREQADDTSTL